MNGSKAAILKFRNTYDHSSHNGGNNDAQLVELGSIPQRSTCRQDDKEV